MSNNEEIKSNNPRVNLGSGLGRTLFISLMLFAMLPLSVAGFFSYQNSKATIYKNEVKALRATVNLRSLSLESYFEERINDLVYQADLDENIAFLQMLKKAFVNSNLPLKQFIKTYEYLSIVSKYHQDLEDFQDLVGYFDTLLIDPQGNVLFSVRGEEGLGENILKGNLKNSEFAKVSLEALKSGKPLCSDLSAHELTGNIMSLFASQSMLDKDGNMIGLIVFQISLDQINKMMSDFGGLGSSGKIYLVGLDGELRSGVHGEHGNAIVKTRDDNKLIHNWLEEEDHWHSEFGEKKGHNMLTSEVSLETGLDGRQVLSISRDIDSLSRYGLHWLMMAEIDKAEAFRATNELRDILLWVFGISVFLVVVLASLLTRHMILPLSKITQWAREVRDGDLSVREIKTQDNEIGTLKRVLTNMVLALESMIHLKDVQDWHKTGSAGLNIAMQGEQDIVSLSQSVLNYLASYLGVQVGAFFVREDEIFRFVSGYAYKAERDDKKVFSLGEGLIGQSALEKKSIAFKGATVEHLDLKITSGLGVSAPGEIIVIPIVLNEHVLGVLEFGTSGSFTEEQINFLEHVSHPVAVAVNGAKSREKMQALLIETQSQKEELQTREEELTASNEELEEANRELGRNSAELEEQSAKLEEQTSYLKKQQFELEKKNEKIELANKYKSEFLANMSHELRTPLNSILLLSSLMAANKDNRLGNDDVESAQTINKSGTDLLNLINEVLDLAKVESGHMDVEVKTVPIRNIVAHMAELFRPICLDKQIEYLTVVDDNLPDAITTDQKRLEQVLKNLLSNSCKFTESGSVTLHVSALASVDKELTGSLSEQNLDQYAMAFVVSDTGIGISASRREVVFEAFQQEDGSTSRKFGGTGLGLSISREIAGLIGGEITMTSIPGKGSSFALFVPDKIKGWNQHHKIEEISAGKIVEVREPESEVANNNKEESQEVYVVDDRKTITKGDKSLLIIDDDPTFASVVRDMAREDNFKVLVAETGEIGLQFADLYRPTAIILDIGLPGMNGWSVLSRLKENGDTRHIPVHVISASDRDTEALKMGALNFITKPVDAETLKNSLMELIAVADSEKKKLLVVEDEEISFEILKEFFKSDDIEIFHAKTGRDAMALLVNNYPDCIILDLGLPDMQGEELLEHIRNGEDLRRIPIIVYTSKELSAKEQGILDQYSQTIVLKDGTSHKRLLAETTLFMHRVEKDLPSSQQEIVKQFYNREEIFNGKKILLVDDDMRNVFSLMKILADKSMKVIVGKDGKEAIEQLEANPDVDLVLMDIMMPVMDGYEAMGEIRKRKKFAKLPIVALTAKAMKGDRKKCIDAGANDYLAKPIDTEQLFSMLRVWLYG